MRAAPVYRVAWPFLDTPRMIFFAEPPGPDEQLGAYGHWIDLLAVHETAHLVHMLRPSRFRPGDAVERGKRVGAVGCTGSCWGDHLHLEIRRGRGTTGRPLDPLPLLRRLAARRGGRE